MSENAQGRESSQIGKSSTSALVGAMGALKVARAAAAPWLRRPGAELVEAARRIRANPRRAILPGSGLALAALAGAFLLSRSPSSALVAPAQRGPFEVKIVEGGTLQALRSVTYSSSIPGSQAKILEIVPEGTHVEVGDVLVKFDREPFAE
ncbi:MAG TPA: hypothetical protein VIG29_00855, partial [Vicinamibacteria bacterium]